MLICISQGDRRKFNICNGLASKYNAEEGNPENPSIRLCDMNNTDTVYTTSVTLNLPSHPNDTGYTLGLWPSIMIGY